MKVNLVSDWREGWKWISVQCFALAAAINGTWYSIPEGLKASIPANYVTIASVTLAGLGIVGRFLEFDGSSNATPAVVPVDHHDHDDHQASVQVVQVQVNNDASAVPTPPAN
jgi:hypothetical protein